jgi:hypothetical protein
VSNLFLLDHPLFQAIFLLQVVFYAVSFAAYILGRRSHSRWLGLPLYFSLSHLAALLGLANVFRRKRAVTWRPGGST